MSETQPRQTARRARKSNIILINAEREGHPPRQARSVGILRIYKLGGENVRTVLECRDLTLSAMPGHTFH